MDVEVKDWVYGAGSKNSQHVIYYALVGVGGVVYKEEYMVKGPDVVDEYDQKEDDSFIMPLFKKIARKILDKHNL